MDSQSPLTTNHTLLSLRCRHVTPKSFASAQFPFEFAVQVSSLLSQLGDKDLARTFNNILLYEQNPEFRLRLLQQREIYGHGLGTPKGFRLLVQSLAFGVHETGGFEVADTLLNYLLSGPRTQNANSQAPQTNLTDKPPATSPSSTASPTTSSTLTPTDSYGLPLPVSLPHPAINSSPNSNLHPLTPHSESHAKRTTLSHIFGGPIVRWNATDHAAGLYGDPGDLDVRGSLTGWVVAKDHGRQGGRGVREEVGGLGQVGQAQEQARVDVCFQQGRSRSQPQLQQPEAHGVTRQSAHDQHQQTQVPAYTPLPAHHECQYFSPPKPNDFDHEFAAASISAPMPRRQANPHPPLPDLPGDESWVQGVDEFIARIERGGSRGGVAGGTPVVGWGGGQREGQACGRGYGQRQGQGGVQARSQSQVHGQAQAQVPTHVTFQPRGGHQQSQQKPRNCNQHQHQHHYQAQHRPSYHYNPQHLANFQHSSTINSQDRHLLDQHLLFRDRREEQFRDERQAVNRGKRMIRTKSEERLARGEGSGRREGAR